MRNGTRRFWSHTYTDWSQITPPYENGERSIQALSVDYMRFMDQSLLGCYLNEADAIRAITPGIPITTNMMSAQCKDVDARTWAPHIDVMSWDCYPLPYQSDPAESAFRHECIRGAQERSPLHADRTIAEQQGLERCAFAEETGPDASVQLPGLGAWGGVGYVFPVASEPFRVREAAQCGGGVGQSGTDPRVPRGCPTRRGA